MPADAPVRYLATARRWPGDTEWDARIDAHRARRPPGWTTVEEPDVPALLRAAEPGAPLLVDDLATWLTGVLDDAQAWEQPTVPAVVGERVVALVDAVATCPGRVVLVSAEVGLGVVREAAAVDAFRRHRVVGVGDGLPLRLK